MDVKNICQKISDGKIREVNEIVDGKNTLDSNAALSILISLCRTLTQKDVNENDIFNLTVTCLENILDLSSDDKDRLLLSLYHVVKYFCKQKSFSNVLTIIDFIRESSVNKNFKTKVYDYYIILFHNYILQNVKEVDGSILHKIIVLSLQMQLLLINRDLNAILSKVKLYSPLFNYPHISNIYRLTYCEFVFKMMESLSLEENIAVYEIYLIIINLYVSSYEKDSFSNCTLKCIENVIEILKKNYQSKDFCNCIEILQYFSRSILKDINDRSGNDLSLLIKCNVKLRAITKNYNEIVNITCNQIVKMIRTILEYLQNCKQMWETHFPISLQIEILKTIEILGQYFSSNEKHNSKFNAALITSSSVIIIQNSIRLELPYTEELHNISFRCLNDCCKYLKTLKMEGIEKFLPIWKNIGIALYNIAVILYRNKNFEISKQYSRLFFENVIIFEGVEDPNLCFEHSLGASLHLHAVCCSLLREKDETLFFLTLCVLFCKEYRKKALQTWVVLKSDATDEIKTITLHNILLEQQESIKVIYPEYVYSKKKSEELLLEELQYYYYNWESKLPISSSCHQLCSISKDTVLRTKSFVLAWKKLVCMLDTKFLENLEETIAQLNQSDTSSQICLSVLYFILYQYKLYEVLDKNLADMNEAYIPLKQTLLQPYEEPPNPNDKCDIVPSFYNMKIDHLLHIYKILENCLSIWSDINFNTNLDWSLILDLNIVNFIKLTAFEYRMLHFDTHMLKTWILYYRFGKYLNDSAIIVTSIGFIIECSDCTTETIHELEKEAEELIPNLNENTPEKLDIISTYYINKSSGYLRNNLLDAGYAALCLAEEYLKDDLKICEARLLHLKTYYLLLPCTNKIMRHDDNFLIIAQESFTVIAEYYKENSVKCPYVLSILFEISLFNGWIYKQLRLPREVRCYTKESIILAQKCVLPIRTAQFLSLLAFTDLLDMQYSDCEVKLTGLIHMLCYTSNIISNKLIRNIKKVEPMKLEIQNDHKFELDFIPTIQTVRDVSTQPRNTHSCQGSPNLKKKPFSVPDFLKHSDNCDCLKCLNGEYHKLILDVVHLEALLNMYQGLQIESEEYFQGVFKLFQIIKQKFEHTTLNISENKVIYPSFSKQLSQSYCISLLSYSCLLIQRSAFSDAQIIINDILKLVPNEQCTNAYFWNELNAQKYNLYLSLEVNNENNCSPKSENNLEVVISTIDSKTPDNKISIPKIVMSLSPIPKNKAVKPRKKIMFDLSDSEDEVEDQKTPEMNKVYKFQTPVKTPAPVMKINNDTPKTVKPQRTKTSSSSLSTNDTSADVNKNINKHLEGRTKLLTGKIKAEKTVVLKDTRNIDSALLQEVDELNDIAEIAKDVEKLSIQSDELDHKIQGNNCKENIVKQHKRYNRIKYVSSSSDSSSGSSEIFVRRSIRIKKN